MFSECNVPRWRACAHVRRDAGLSSKPPVIVVVVVVVVVVIASVVITRMPPHPPFVRHAFEMPIAYKIIALLWCGLNGFMCSHVHVLFDWDGRNSGWLVCDSMLYCKIAPFSRYAAVESMLGSVCPTFLIKADCAMMWLTGYGMGVDRATARCPKTVDVNIHSVCVCVLCVAVRDLRPA